MFRKPLLFWMLAAAGLTGCVQETISDSRSAQPQIFEWPEDLEGWLHPVGAFHGLSLIAEVPPEHNVGSELENQPYYVVPDRRPDGSEIYRIKGHQDVVFANGRWTVGSFSVKPRGGNTHLWLFLERQGNFEFLLHRQPVIIETPSKWSPVISYYTFEELEDGSIKPRDAKPGIWARVYTHEVVEIGRAKIEVNGRTGMWTVNGRVIRPTFEAPIIIEDAVRWTDD